MGAHRSGRRAGRSDQRAGARLPLFRSVARRSRRRRRRHADAARRSLAAGAPRARRCAGREPRRAAGNHFRACRRSAEHRRAGAGAVAAVRRCRSGRCGGDRRSGGPGRGREPRGAAALGRGRNRRSRHRGSLPGARRKSRRRLGPAVDRSHRRALRSSRRDPRAAVGARRSCGGDAPNPCRQAFADAGRLRRRDAPGSTPITPSASRARLARRRRSPSPPTARRRKFARSSAICA